jgi:HEAT repeat protein
VSGVRPVDCLQIFLDGLSSPAVDARVLAAERLGRMAVDDPRIVPALETALADPFPDVRVAAVTALGMRKGGGHPVTRLFGGALRDADRLVRSAAVFALAKVGDPAAMPALLAALNDPEIPVRRDAVWAVGRLGGGTSNTLDKLSGALKDADPSVRYWAACSLERLGAGERLAGHLNDPDAGVRMLARRSIATSGPEG